MKRLKIFPKTFAYTLVLMLFIVIVAHALLFILAPKMAMETAPINNMTSYIIISTVIDPTQFVTQTVQRALPISLICCILLSIGCSLLFSRDTTIPIRQISKVTKRMAQMDKSAACMVHSQDEIGILANNINCLYQNLLSTIENLEIEKQRVSESEQSKVNFLRAASHELKTPVTALNATLENMILGVGKYKDYETYLPECKEMVEQISDMIHEIIESSKAGLSVENEPTTEINISELLLPLCEPYQLITKAHGIVFHVELSENFTTILPSKLFCKAVSNVLANAVSYTERGKMVAVYLDNHRIIIENECIPIPEKDLKHLFEPFYRPDFARDRDNGGNGLGLYIVDTLLHAMNIPYTFCPMQKPYGMRFTIEL
ncbi:sensor histidine kinase [Anaerotignum sp.]|uniref:sensor histidine kinase n=1 Tax=Anaerotignum sp. TaxID=2039241 RepID=UPI002714A88B|nr:HAMP domain-containing sensor histidine kinase [Anaerotignum sp.]